MHGMTRGPRSCGAQPGSIFLADQQLPVLVPRVRDRAAQYEVALATYAALQTPRAQDAGLFRRVLGGLSCREYEAAAEAVPEAFGLAKSSVSRRFIRRASIMFLHPNCVAFATVFTVEVCEASQAVCSGGGDPTTTAESQLSTGVVKERDAYAPHYGAYACPQCYFTTFGITG
ncbi:hypothetical protein BH11GEM2_BH11GEM2_29010 [soil metagenome]